MHLHTGGIIPVADSASLRPQNRTTPRNGKRQVASDGRVAEPECTQEGTTNWQGLRTDHPRVAVANVLVKPRHPVGGVIHYPRPVSSIYRLPISIPVRRNTRLGRQSSPPRPAAASSCP